MPIPFSEEEVPSGLLVPDASGNYDTAGGNLNAANVTGSGIIEVGKNTNGVSHINKARIESDSFGAGSIASFSHHDCQLGNNIALVQTDAGETWVNSETGRTLTFRIGGQEKVRLDTNGNFGIGTTSPSEKLDVDGSIRARGNIRLGTSSDPTIDDDNNRFISTAGQLFIHANDSGLNGGYIGLTLQTGTTNQGKIVMGGGTQHHNRRMQFYTSSTERMRIDWNGNVGINKTNPSKKLHVGGDIQADGTVIGASSSFGSDDRLKHNEEDISDSLSVIRQLKPQKYQKSKQLKAADFNGPLEEDDIFCVEAGFIAQDVLKLPELAYSVTGGDYTESIEDSEGNVTDTFIEQPYYLNYNNILTYNVAATKELDATMTALLAEVASLKKRLSALEL